MTLKEIIHKINWREPKYALPAILYPLLLLAGYAIIDLFNVKLAEAPSKMQTTEYLNPELPQAQLRNEEIGGKYENMAKSYGKIQDYSAVENIERETGKETEDYSSKYTSDDLAYLDAEAEKRLQEMQYELDASQKRGETMATDSLTSPLNDTDRIALGRQRQQVALEELNKALAEARLKSRKSIEDLANGSDKVDEMKIKGIELGRDKNEGYQGNVKNEGKEGNDNSSPKMVTKTLRPASSYFNTISENEPENELIKAIIDENITAVDGSRVRLRLLDDVEIGNAYLTKGTYLYATMNGFGSQRVKGNVNSLMVDDELVKVELSIYDTDGLEGLYVPSSSFRETSKEVAAAAMNGNMSISNGSYSNSLSQWGMQAIQNAYQRSSSAISKAIRKNKATLKYGTFVYLVNSHDSNKNQ